MSEDAARGRKDSEAERTRFITSQIVVGKQVEARYRRREGEFHARRRGIAEQTCCEHKYSDKLGRATGKQRKKQRKIRNN